MSKENEKEKIEEQTSDETQDIIDTNVSLTIAERDHYKELVETLKVSLDEMTKRYENAKALIEEDSKASLINDIIPMVHLPRNVLAEKTRDELEQWKKVLDNSKYTFKAGTPLKLTEDSPEHRLNTMFERNMAKLRGGNT